MAIANERHHQYATLEHLLLSLIDDSDAAAVMREFHLGLVPLFGTCIMSNMNIVGFDLVAALIARERRERPQQGKTLDRRIAAWKHEVEQARWTKPTEVKAVFGTADIVGGNRIGFDICGNSYRLVVQFNYAAQVARVLFAVTHKEYDRIDVRMV